MCSVSCGRSLRGCACRLELAPHSATTARSDADEALGGAEGALFLRRSGLNNEQLREVWRLASGGTSKQKLDRSDWNVACKLVAATQSKGVEPSMMAVVGTEPLPLADFHYDIDPDVELEMAAEIEVRVYPATASGDVGRPACRCHRPDSLARCIRLRPSPAPCRRARSLSPWVTRRHMAPASASTRATTC